MLMATTNAVIDQKENQQNGTLIHEQDEESKRGKDDKQVLLPWGKRANHMRDWRAATKRQ